MTERTYHIIAVSVIVAGIAAGGVSWVLDGAAFYVAAGIGAALIIAGLIIAGRAPGQKDGHQQPRR